MWNKNQYFLIKNLFTFKRQTVYKQCSIRFRVKDFEGVGFLNKTPTPFLVVLNSFCKNNINYIKKV